MLKAVNKMAATSLDVVYRRLRGRYGPAGWWPGRSRFEVCVGAILTQNTAWSNVEKALAALRSARRLSYPGLRGVRARRIAPLIRSSGTYRVKARRLAAFVRFLERRYGGRVAAMRRADPWELRQQLLGVDGIGRETADCIVLYAAGLPVFVVDAYTRRVFQRLGLISGREEYDRLQRFFMQRLPADAGLFNDYHAQIVRLAKDACRPRPVCPACPLEDLCPKRGLAEADGEPRRHEADGGTRR